MLLYLQIALTILSALCIALVIPLGSWLGLGWAIGLALAAVMFFMLMKLCKQTREFRGKTDEQAEMTEETERTEETDKNPKTEE